MMGSIHLVGAGPGDPELLTLRAARRLAEADVILHDQLVSEAILALGNPAARRVHVGKIGGGPSTPQAEIEARMIAEAQAGHRVVRLKGGDASVFGRLDEETSALSAAGIEWQVVPGVTAASAAAASIGQSLTSRGRNRALRLITAQDMQGYADQDWRALAGPGAVTAVYMGKRAARFVQGRLFMHGASPDMAVTLVENASRPEQRIIATTLAGLPQQAAALCGPAIILLGLAPKAATETLQFQETAP
jgi:uroporphyrin-III C-methyltransferase